MNDSINYNNIHYNIYTYINIIYPLIPSLTTHHTSTPPSCKMQGCKVARFGATLEKWTIFFVFWIPTAGMRSKPIFLSASMNVSMAWRCQMMVPSGNKCKFSSFYLFVSWFYCIFAAKAARTGFTSAKSELSALGLHRLCRCNLSNDGLWHFSTSSTRRWRSARCGK